ncbi:MAG: hypothetical protein NC200_04145 [Candidatus Gastranaerophilales bacterium]|nr:hypothetical protein [Candidatus Gastranaerophilales bacterium]
MVIRFQGFPSGTWRGDGNGNFVRTNFEDSEIFASSGVPVLSHEPYSAIGPQNVADWTDPTYYGDNSLRNRKLVADIHVVQGYYDSMASSGSNFFNIDSSFINIDGSNNGTTSPFTPSSSNNGISVTYTPSTGIGSNPFSSYSPNYSPNGAGNTGSANGAGSGDFVNNPESNTPQSQFNSRLKLIQQYCDKYGNSVDVNEIKQKYANNPEEGVKYCDDIINNKFKQSRVEKIVKDQYQAKLDAQLEKGQSISDDWVETAIKNGTGTPNFNTSGVNKNNVLDVIGTFMTNDEVKNGKVSLENIFEQPEAAAQLMNAIKAKANEMLKRPDIDDETKESISAKLEDLVDYVDNFSEKYGDEFTSSPFAGSPSRRQAVNKYTELFTELRTIQAQKNDEAAPEHYGLPEDSSISLTNYTDRANEEIKAHRNRKRLNTNI